MATMEQLKAHITTTNTTVDEPKNTGGVAIYDPAVRTLHKKYTRLTRKVGKIVYMEKKKEEKGKKKKTSGGE